MDVLLAILADYHGEGLAGDVVGIREPGVGVAKRVTRHLVDAIAVSEEAEGDEKQGDDPEYQDSPVEEMSDHGRDFGEVLFGGDGEGE